ncbi:bifunctional phosphopantothenoylcysteine decarboxylase/phosphopantothenate--cysteine ligase CoaBC [Corallincola luteus]|uniref:Coenzyme A biosynthesis bifunctional protein CoaBC n=2 Tax=Corallincola TaxID=1775176 RepID=A0A368NKU9_9GAMM|nr:MULTISPECIES: bifunctional phosphopantothenoylcysteine decarboxylase/phosphopantothenate--cysteine ligase CoaBC [Corallincola]RCU51068.1 bifunctional phosphopantothenoylcysteine decarboxylase/phosphopantothenate--cysteine ligase CoaBC [Corallincola holothuriorum]TCI04108.1 bifunctional phosphopantothenoylcysteine decarboxylase/phosphopantothenate--cysteine ligase CoaBC [Corallincola luteus]
MSLQGKKILLGISAGIAAYKCVELTRRLKDKGADVRIVMTKGAQAFITPLTLQAVSGYPICDDLLDPSAEAAMGHIELGKWADLLVIAPATADLIARIAAGMANDLLSTVCLATPAPIAIAPAMNQQMYLAVPTQENLALLAKRQHLIWGPGQGEQACGDVGPGRMLEPAELLALIEQQFQPHQPLAGVKMMITAGPTREALDPVRYLSNHSSGKMGYAIAASAAQMGAEVTLVSGPVALQAPTGVQLLRVESAAEMHHAVMTTAVQQDIFVACAAVADYRPEAVADCKIKKDNSEMSIRLVRNPDILADVAALNSGPFTVGFAAETHDVETYAIGKLQRKGLDMIAANDVSDSSIGFNSDDNALTLYWADGKTELPATSKQQLAAQLLEQINHRYRIKQ